MKFISFPEEIYRTFRSRAGKTHFIFGMVVGIFLLGILIFYSLNAVALFSPSQITTYDHVVECYLKNGNYSGCQTLGAACTWQSNNISNVYPYCAFNTTTYNTTYMNQTGGLLINAGCCTSSSGGGGSRLLQLEWKSKLMPGR